MRHPRNHVPGKPPPGPPPAARLSPALRTATGRPVRSPPTLVSAGPGLAAGGLMVYEWLTPRSWLYGPVFWHARTASGWSP